MEKGSRGREGGGRRESYVSGCSECSATAFLTCTFGLLMAQKASQSPWWLSGFDLGGIWPPVNASTSPEAQSGEKGWAVPEQVAEPVLRCPGLLKEDIQLGIRVRGDRAMLAAAAAQGLPGHGQG